MRDNLCHALGAAQALQTGASKVAQLWNPFTLVCARQTMIPFNPPLATYIRIKGRPYRID